MGPVSVDKARLRGGQGTADDVATSQPAQGVIESTDGEPSTPASPEPAAGPSTKSRSEAELHRVARSQRRRTLLWLGFTVLTVVLAACIPLLYTPRYYFLGDTQIGAFGQWYHLGEKLRSGEWPLLDLQAWHGGNYVAEGQWGLFSPLTMGLALLATMIEHTVVFVTVVKFALLVAGAVGAFLLARSYGIPQPGAYVAGVAVTLGGATQYLDAPEWVTSQMVWALIPYAWWATRRTMTRRANPVLALVFGLLTVTVGYVYGTIYLAVVLLACLVEAWVARNLAAAVRVLVIGACCGLVAVTVYLPGMLTASVTTRSGWEVLSDGRLQADLPGLLGSMIPSVLSPSSPVPPMVRYPAHYIAWFLPLLAWLDLREARRLLRPAAGLLTVVGIGLLWALGPNQIGPLRWPIRVLPFLSMAVVVLTMLCWSRAMLRRPPLRRLLLSLLITAGAAYLILARFWDQSSMTMVNTAVVLGGLIVLWVLTRAVGRRAAANRAGGASPTPDRPTAPRRPGAVPIPGGTTAPRSPGLWLLAIFLAGWGVVAMAVQHEYYPFPTAVDRHMPATLSAYTTQAAGARGDVIMAGNPEPDILQDPRAVRDFLIASSWYVSPHPVQNVYSTIGFTAYNDQYGMRFDGATYPWLIYVLSSYEPRTALPRADLLSISSVLLVRRDFGADTVPPAPPPGWHVANESALSLTWVRDQPLPPAGGLVWASPGLAVTQVSSTTREARVRVDRAPSQGGQLVFSRLAWPGYAVSGGGLAAPVDGYLLTVDVPATAAGQTIAVRYSPPGWQIERLAGLLGVGLGAVWSLAFAVARLVRRRRGPVRA